MRGEILYSEVDSSESESDTKPKGSNRWRRVFYLLAAVILSSIATILLVTTIFPLPKRAQVRQCGASSSEAKAKGCKFDPVTFAWLPGRNSFALFEMIQRGIHKLTPTQRNATTTNSPMSGGRDSSKSMRILMETSPKQKLNLEMTWVLVFLWRFSRPPDTSLLTISAYITNSVHIQHCSFSWRMMHRAFLSGKTPHAGLSYAHTKHCSSVIVKQGDGNIIETGAKVTYPACWCRDLGWWSFAKSMLTLSFGQGIDTPAFSIDFWHICEWPSHSNVGRSTQFDVCFSPDNCTVPCSLSLFTYNSWTS